MKINLLPQIKTISSQLKTGINRIMPSKKEIQQDCFKYSYNFLKYEKSSNLAEVHSFVNLNFPNTHLNITSTSDGNRILRTMCHLHNMTRGQINFPPRIETYKSKDKKFSGDYGDGIIRINSSCNIHESTLAHEIAHYNHELLCPNYAKMGKLSEMKAEEITDFSIYNKFRRDLASLNLIKRTLCGYAASSPCEFVAATFEALANGKILPIKIWELYKKYEGPFADMLKPFFTK